jgi:hypothetical protein
VRRVIHRLELEIGLRPRLAQRLVRKRRLRIDASARLHRSDSSFPLTATIGHVDPALDCAFLFDDAIDLMFVSQLRRFLGLSGLGHACLQGIGLKGNYLPRLAFLQSSSSAWNSVKEATKKMRGIILWLLGVPLVAIILLYVFNIL